MTSIRNFRLAAFGAALLAGASFVAVAQPPVNGNAQGATRDGNRAERADRAGRTDGRQGGQRGPGASLLRGITLTDAQKTRVEALRAEQRKNAPARGTRPGARPDSARGERQRPDSAARAQMMAQRQARFTQEASSLRAILTPAQQSTFDQNLKTTREQMATRGQNAEGKGKRGGDKQGNDKQDSNKR